MPSISVYVNRSVLSECVFVCIYDSIEGVAMKILLCSRDVIYHQVLKGQKTDV